MFFSSPVYLIGGKRFKILNVRVIYLRYYQSLAFNDCVYSIDKLIVTGKFKYNSFDSFQASLSALLIHETVVERAPFELGVCRDNYYTSRKKLSFTHNFKFELMSSRWGGGETASFWLGTHFQTYEKTVDNWKLEINPNKCMPCPFVSALFNLLVDCSKSYEVTEFDVAVDLPVSRDSVIVCKDKRKYACVVNSLNDCTEYLGSRHCAGFCKVYNKQIESGLEFACTRFEMTFDRFDTVAFLDCVPVVYIFRQQMSVVSGRLNDTDKFILKTLIAEPRRIGELSYHYRKKMSDLLSCAVDKLVLDKKTISSLMCSLSNLSNFFYYDVARCGNVE